MAATEQELELKFRTTAAGVRAAMESELLSPTAPLARATTLKSIYFDTQRSRSGEEKDDAPHSPHRSRRADHDAETQAHQVAGPIFTRRDRGSHSRGVRRRSNFSIPPSPSELADLLQLRPLEPQFQTNVRRRIRLVEFGGSTIEAAFDQGFIQAGERRMRLNEVELELKSGAAADLYDLGVRLVDSLPLRIDATSKAQAAFAFARGEPSPPVKSEPIQFAQSAAVDEAIAAILQNALDHFIANWASFRESRHPESIHQLRVALRRLRSALTMLKAIAPCPAFEAFGRQARELGAEFGRARQCDVFKDLVDEGPKTWAHEKATFAPLDLALASQTASAYGRAAAALESAKASVFAIELQA